MRKAEDVGQPISSSLIALACANPPQAMRNCAAATTARMPSPGASPVVSTRLRESPRQSPKVAQPYAAEAVQLVGSSGHRNSRRATEAMPRHGRNPSIQAEASHEAVAHEASTDGSKLPDISKWNWTPCENRPELLTFHDGQKRWFHCSKCEYWNDRLYHTKMHYERIHVKQGRSMPRKRKYVEVDQPDAMLFRSPDKRPGVEAGSTVTPHRQEGGKKTNMETPKGKGVQASTNKSTPLTKSAYSSAQSPSKGGRAGKSSSRQSNAKGSFTSSPPGSASSAAAPGAKRGDLDRAFPARSGGSGSKIKGAGEHTSRVFVFGSLFFQDRGPRLALDVASWSKSAKRRSAVSKTEVAVGARKGKAINASPKKGDLSREMAIANASSVQKRMKMLPGNCLIAGGSGACATVRSVASAARPSAQCSSLQGQDGRSGKIAKLEPMGGAKAGPYTEAQAESSSGLSDTSPASSPVRTQVFAPATPVHQRPSALCAERSPALGDGMQALDGMHGLTHGSLLSGSVSSTQRRQAFIYSENLGLTSAPDSSPSKMYVPSSPPLGSVMTDINAIPPMSGGCLYDASPSRQQYHLRSPPLTPTTNRCFMPGHSQPPISAGLARTSLSGRAKREASSEIFSPLDGKADAHQHLYGLDSDNLNLLCNELMSPFHAP